MESQLVNLRLLQVDNLLVNPLVCQQDSLVDSPLANHRIILQVNLLANLPINPQDNPLPSLVEVQFCVYLIRQIILTPLPQTINSVAFLPVKMILLLLRCAVLTAVFALGTVICDSSTLMEPNC